MFKNLDKNNKGFTLIELLVVIAILSLLSSVILASLGNARKNAERRAFGAQIVEFQKALQLYYEDNNGQYPDNASLPNVISMLVNEGYLGSSFDLLDTAIHSYYYGRPNAYVACGSSSNPLSSNDYMFYIWDPDVNYSKDVNSNFKDVYFSGNNYGYGTYYYQCIIYN